jgi:3'-phosphoadenosine 5'-phosphosulfate (PAPS) 3'-phosphatase
MRKQLEEILKGLGAALLEGEEHPDEYAHDYLCHWLGKLTPGMPILSEEAPWPDKRPAAYWLIDPLDGTASYLEGFPGWVVQVALMDAGEPTLAAVYAPKSREFYFAAYGQGATLNGFPLEVDANAGTAIDNTPKPSEVVQRAMERCHLWNYLESGSLGLKLCRVADGTASLFFKYTTVRDWDIAAGALILREASGTLTGIDGEPFEFTGEVEKPGVIAAASFEIAERFLSE